ncbi:MAG: peptidoglycan-binding protein [Bernardetiaceae bacterium]|nr:peptidoglycan-binding protein [Bernardetiaceae bacterium]
MSALSVGTKGRSVMRLQKMLNELGYTLPTDGVFTDALKEAVIDFQTNKEITADGIVDRQTKVTLKRMRRRMRRANRRGSPLPYQIQPNHNGEDIEEPDLIPEAEDEDFDEGLNTQEESISEEETKAVEAKEFNSLKEAQTHYQQLQRNGASAAALGAFRKRAILAVYGNSPSVSEINELKHLVYSQSWLKPEGEDLYLFYITDSPNYFKSGVTRKGVYFGYTATRRNSDTFDLKIFRVFNNQSNLRMSTQIKAEIVNGVAEVAIYRGQRESYKWIISKTEVLHVKLEKGKSEASAQASAALQAQADNSHGIHNHKSIEEDKFTLKNAIKTALKIFIAEYGHLMS